jgi:hypothetical protein
MLNLDSILEPEVILKEDLLKEKVRKTHKKKRYKYVLMIKHYNLLLLNCGI